MKKRVDWQSWTNKAIYASAFVILVFAFTIALQGPTEEQPLGAPEVELKELENYVREIIEFSVSEGYLTLTLEEKEAKIQKSIKTIIAQQEKFGKPDLDDMSSSYVNSIFEINSAGRGSEIISDEFTLIAKLREIIYEAQRVGPLNSKIEILSVYKSKKNEYIAKISVKQQSEKFGELNLIGFYYYKDNKWHTLGMSVSDGPYASSGWFGGSPDGIGWGHFQELDVPQMPTGLLICRSREIVDKTELWSKDFSQVVTFERRIINGQDIIEGTIESPCEKNGWFGLW